MRLIYPRSDHRRRQEIARTHGQDITITPQRRFILAALLEYRYLTASLLGTVYEREFGRGRIAVRNHLTALFRAGLVERHYYHLRDAGEGGSDEFVYVLNPEGAKRVMDPAQWRRHRKTLWNRSRRKKTPEHHLLGSALQVILGDPGHPFRVVDFFADQEERDAFLTVPLDPLRAQERKARSRHRQRDWRVAYLRPDETVLIDFPGRGRLLCYVEQDRSRKTKLESLWRFQHYALHYQRGFQDGGDTRRQWEEAYPGTPVNGMLVLFLAPTVQDAKLLIAHAREALFGDVVGGKPPLVSPLGIGRRNAPQFLFWPYERWFFLESVRREAQRERRGERTVRETHVPRLKDPRQILTEPQLLTLTGRERALFPATG